MYAAARPQHTRLHIVQAIRVADSATCAFEAGTIVMLGSSVMGALRIAARVPRATWLCAALCLLRVSPAAAATDEEKAGARAAATQGLTAYDKQHWAEA